MIAAVLWAGIGVALVVLGSGLRQRWRGYGSHPWPAVLAVALLLGGIVLAWLMHWWLGGAALVYSGYDGRPAGPTPSPVIGFWPLVQRPPAPARHAARWPSCSYR